MIRGSAVWMAFVVACSDGQGGGADAGSFGDQADAGGGDDGDGGGGAEDTADLLFLNESTSWFIDGVFLRRCGSPVSEAGWEVDLRPGDTWLLEGVPLECWEIDVCDQPYCLGFSAHTPAPGENTYTITD
jgi:hypothetical protein